MCLGEYGDGEKKKKPYQKIVSRNYMECMNRHYWKQFTSDMTTGI